jgi:hypothetical protein
MNEQKALWAGGGCLGGCLISLFLCILLGIGGYTWAINLHPEEIELQLQHPILVAEGDDVTLEFEIRNLADVPQTLNSIDFNMNYLAGLVIAETEPASVGTSTYDSLDGTETFTSYYFDQTIPPGESLVVTFIATAATEGDYAGQISVCVNSGMECLYKSARTVVEE